MPVTLFALSDTASNVSLCVASLLWAPAVACCHRRLLSNLTREPADGRHLKPTAKHAMVHFFFLRIVVVVRPCEVPQFRHVLFVRYGGGHGTSRCGEPHGFKVVYSRPECQPEEDVRRVRPHGSQTRRD